MTQRPWIPLCLVLAGLSSARAGLVGRWDPLHAAGAGLDDLSGNGNAAALPTRTDPGGAVVFDGFTYVTVRGPLNGTPPAEITFSVWVYPNSTGNRMIMGKCHTNENWDTPMPGLVFSEGGRVSFKGWDAEIKGKFEVAGKTVIPARGWAHLAATYDGRSLRLYVDGVPEAEREHTAGFAWDDRPLYIGAANLKGPFFRGRIADARVYDTALSPEDVAAICREGREIYPVPPPAAAARDGVRMVESKTSPGSAWKEYPTTTLELLDGYEPTGGVEPDRYGGWAGKAGTATGFFRVEKIGDRWWLVDPDGNRFIHSGIVAVSPGGSATARKNFETRFGGDRDAWARQATDMLLDNGFNGTGAWSDVTSLRAAERKVAYTVITGFMVSFAGSRKLTRPGVGHSGFLNDCIPVFHPEFEPFCTEYATRLAETADDPWLLGIFSDNELLPARLGKFLELDPDDPDQAPNHRAALQWLRTRTGNPRAGAGEVTPALDAEFGAYAFEEYYRVVSQAIRKVDPNHLYLGSRLNTESDKVNPYLWQAAGKYVDLIAMNYYRTWTPDVDLIRDWCTWSGKPVIITEWYVKGDDVGFPNTTGAGWIVRTQADRGLFYQHFVLKLLESQGIVGWHWFKYMDNDPDDPKAEASNRDANKGVVRLDYTEYEPLLERMKQVNRETYPLTEFFDRRTR